jgi:hypothetical protein
MKQLIPALLLVPTLGRADVLLVDYVGTVSEVDKKSPPKYHVGQTISGRLIADLSMAPPDVDSDPDVAWHSLFLQPGQSDWITGFSGNGENPSDHIIIGNGRGGGDFFQIRDGNRSRDIGLSVQVSGPQELFAVADIERIPAFEVTRGDKPSTFGGNLHFGMDEGNGVTIALDKLSATPTLLLDVEIRPEVIVPHSRGLVHIALLSAPTLDALQIDPLTLRFGTLKPSAPRTSVHDVNRDGVADLVVAFRIPSTGIVCGDTTAVISGRTYDGQAAAGTAQFRTAGCKDRRYKGSP